MGFAAAGAAGRAARLPGPARGRLRRRRLVPDGDERPARWRPSTASRSPGACSTTARSARSGTSSSTASTTGSSPPSSTSSRTSRRSPRRAAATASGSRIRPRSSAALDAGARGERRRAGPPCSTSSSPASGCCRALEHYALLSRGARRARTAARPLEATTMTMLGFGLPTGAIFQYAYVVDDIDARDGRLRRAARDRPLVAARPVLAADGAATAGSRTRRPSASRAASRGTR